MAHPVISVDVMGGDHGPEIIVDGIDTALAQRAGALRGRNLARFGVASVICAPDGTDLGPFSLDHLPVKALAIHNGALEARHVGMEGSDVRQHVGRR